jgi:toxin CptA
MKSAPAIAFEYRPSRWVRASLVSVALLATIAIAASALALPAKVILAVAACAYALYAARGVLCPVVRGCAWYESGHWRVRDAAGEDHAASLLRASVRGVMIVLVLRSALQRSTAVILLPDNCDADTRRRLRVRLSRATIDAQY